MRADTFSIRSHHGSKSAVEKAAQAIFTACGFFAVLASGRWGIVGSSFAATVVVIFLSRASAVINRCPVTIFLISGIFPLVPGAGIYWTVYYLVTDQLGLAVHTGYAAVKAAVAIVLGIVAVFELPQGMFAWTAGKLRRIPGFCSRSRG